MVKLAEGVQGFDTTKSAESYARLNSIGYDTSVKAIVDKMTLFLKNIKGHAWIVEIGAGQRKATIGIDASLKKHGFSNVTIIPLEPSSEQTKMAPKVDSGDQSTPPLIRNGEILPIKTNSAKGFLSSQVLHWVTTSKKLLELFKEGSRILVKDGFLVHAVSGLVDLKEYNKYHFTRAPFYLEAYLPEVKKLLIEHGFWSEDQGEFVPWNHKVNPFYHKYTLHDIRKIIKKAGFKDVKIDIYFARLGPEEWKKRCAELSMLKMHLFKSKRLKEIPENLMEEIGKQAFEQAKLSRSDLWNELSQETSEVMNQMPENLTHGEPVPVITARKK